MFTWQDLDLNSLNLIITSVILCWNICDVYIQLIIHQVLLELARNRNKIPLPRSIAGPGIPLPPEQDTLLSPNYQLAIPKKQPSPAVEETEEDEEGVDPNPSQEQKTDMPQHTPQRVSFPLTKRPKWTFWTVQEQLDPLVLSNRKNINMSTIMLISFGMKYDKIICLIQCRFCLLSSRFPLLYNIQKVIQIAEHMKAEFCYCLRFRKWLKLPEISCFSLEERLVKFSITKGGRASNCKYWWLYSFLMSIADESAPFINRCLDLFENKLCMKLLASPYKLF